MSRSGRDCPLEHMSEEEFVQDMRDLGLDDMQLSSEGFMALSKELTDLEFAQFKTNEERMKKTHKICQVFHYIYTDKINEQLRAIQGRLNFKVSAAAKALRLQGNIVYERRNYRDAILTYTKGLAHAPPKSDEMAMAYSNRSAVLRTMEKYSDCLIDIQRALDNGYPESQRYELLLRRAQCQRDLGQASEAAESFQQAAEYLKRQTDLSEEKKQQLTKYLEQEKTAAAVPPPWEASFYPDPPALTTEPSKEAPCASSAVKIEYNDTLGRHLVATEDINVGDILCVERPFVSVLDVNKRWDHCTHCMQLCFAPLPCDNCAMVVFCSAKCKTEAGPMYHHNECVVLSKLQYAVPQHGITLEEFSLATIRAIAMIGINNLRPYLKYAKTYTDPSTQSNEEKRTKGFNSNGVYDSSDFHTLCNFVSHIEKQPYDFYWPRCLWTLYIVKAFDITDDHPDLHAISGVILHLMCSLQTSMIASFIADVVFPPGKGMPEHIGYASGVQPFISLMSHDCTPNTYFTTHGTTCALRATEPIPKGSLITVNYCANNITKAERQYELKKTYFFTCNCKACEKDLPIHRKFDPSFDDSSLFDKMEFMRLMYIDNIQKAMITVRKRTTSQEEFVNEFADWAKVRMDFLTRMYRQEKTMSIIYRAVMRMVHAFFMCSGNMHFFEQ